MAEKSTLQAMRLRPHKPIWLWRVALAVSFTLGTSAFLNAESGILLYTVPGTPFAECVRYKKLLKLQEGITVAVKTDGKSVNISDPEIVANIPYPSDEKVYDEKAIADFVAICNLQAIRQPKHAGLLKMSADLWKRELQKLKAETPVADQSRSPANEQASAVETPESSQIAATPTPLEEASGDIATQLARIKQLADLKKWQELAVLCRGLANSADESLRYFAEIGAELSAALDSLTLARQEMPKATARATRLRKDADMKGRPNPLRPDDTSGMQEAQALRAEAEAIEHQVQAAIGEAEGRIADLASLIDRTVRSAETSVRMKQKVGAEDAEQQRREVAASTSTAHEQSAVVQRQHTSQSTSLPSDGTQASYASRTKTPPEDKRTSLLIMRGSAMEEGARISVSTAQSREYLLEAASSREIPELGMTFDTCVERFPVTITGIVKTPEQIRHAYSQAVVVSEEGWTQSYFRFGDIVARILFDPSGMAGLIILTHAGGSRMFDLPVKDLETLRDSMAPGYLWGAFQKIGDKMLTEGMSKTGAGGRSGTVLASGKETGFSIYTQEAWDYVQKYPDVLD